MNTARILLVEDELTNLRLYQTMLNECDYVIETAADGKECLEKARTSFPDLILMDWNMPVMDGMEALSILKADPVLKDIPVLMVTGIMTSSEDLSKAMMLGAADFMKKPFERLELQARVRNLLLLNETLKTLRVRNLSLENSYQFVSSILESIPHPVTYSSTEGILLMCNQPFGQLLGRECQSLLGQSVYRYGSAENLEIHLQHDAQLLKTRKSVVYEINSSLDNRSFILSKNILFNGQNSPTGIVTVFTDVSELKKANEEIVATKKVELISSTLRLMHLSETHSNLISEMEGIIPNANPEGQSLIRQLQNRYKVNLAEQVLVDFEARLENAFDTFFTALGEKFPALTLNERKLCALLRSGLSSKEIAVLTFQNPASVDVARYRLRKKLNLSAEDRLIDFLLMLEK
ncbi:MAG: response regulator [Mangrovibacterium sp.]